MNELPRIAWHVTSQAALPSIATEGLRAGSYWTTDETVRDYYMETIKDEGQEPVVLLAKPDHLQAFSPEPDRPGLQEPITCALGMTEEEIWEGWEASGQTWEDCVKLIGSFRLKDPVPAAILTFPPTTSAGFKPR